MRVHELAKEYGIKSTDFVDVIQSFGIDIKSHLSGLDDAQVADIKFKMDMKDHTKVEELNPLGNLTQEEVDEVFDKDPEAFEEYQPDLKPTHPSNKEVLEPETEETIDEKNERRHQEISEENEKVLAREKEYRERVIAKTQKVIVEKPTGFWAWLKSIFS